MISKLSRMQEIWKIEREKNIGCGEAMMEALKIDNWADLDNMHGKFCPKVRINTSVYCRSACIFSCVDTDVDKMAEVLRTLEVANEPSK